MNWNDDFSLGLDWADPDFLDMFRDALYQRKSVLRFGGPAATTAPPDYLPIPVDPGDVQGSYIRDLQIELATIIGHSDTSFNEAYIDPDLVGIGGYPFGMDFDAVRLKAGVTTLDRYRRKKPREFTATADPTIHTDPDTGVGYWTVTSGAQDIDDNVIADGMRAFGLRPGKRTRTYVFDAALGAWTTLGLVRADKPDVLDVDLAAPNAVKEIDFFQGLMSPGDIIGDWLWAEMRDMINVLDTTGQNFLPGGGTISMRLGVATGAPDWATAMATAVAAFDADVPDAFDNGHWASYTDGNLVGGTTYDAGMYRIQRDTGVLNDPGPLNRDVEWWVNVVNPPISGSPSTITFDPAPDSPPIAAGWVLLHTEAGSSITDPIYTFPPDGTLHPTFPGAPTVAIPHKGNGWEITQKYGVMRWRVPGGFTYTIDT